MKQKSDGFKTHRFFLCGILILQSGQKKTFAILLRLAFICIR